MNNIRAALREMKHIDAKTQKETLLTKIHPCVKLAITFLYLITVVSFQKYNLSGILGMSIYLIIVYHLGDISRKETYWRLKGILLLLLFVGTANLFMDRRAVSHWGTVTMTGGMFSFVTLYIKGVFALLASYALIITTGIENIGYALQVFRLPKILITIILLIFRYLILFMKEADRISLAYSMRAPGQKGVHMKAWGSMVGAMLIRSIDRAEIVYESMRLRGFRGVFTLKMTMDINQRISIVYGVSMSILILFLRLFPVFDFVGLYLQGGMP